MQDRYRWERLRDGDEGLKFIYGFECSEKNLPLVREFFRGHVVVVDRFDPEHPELESAEHWGLSQMSIRTRQSKGLESITYI